jgi:micrococcal nuclease
MSLAAVALAGCGEFDTSVTTPTAGTRSTATPVPTTTPSAPSVAPTVRPRGEAARGFVVYVSDGDTVGVSLDGVVTRIRLVGIDAPESKDPNEPQGCFGPRAAAIAERLLPPGRRVVVVTDPTQDRLDRYGRLLAYVIVPGDRVTVNEELVRRGAARVYVYRRNTPPRRIGVLRRAEEQARQAKRGLWGACPAG